MIPTDFIRYESVLTPTDFQKIGQLLLRWSLIDHTVGNCLRVILRLTHDEAVSMVFSLSADVRFQRIRDLTRLNPLSPEADFLFRELDAVMTLLRPVRNDLAHAIMDWTPGGTVQEFHNRSKRRNVAKNEVFETEDLTTYAVILAQNLRLKLGPKDVAPGNMPPAVPDRPILPSFLKPPNNWPTRPMERAQPSPTQQERS